MKTNILYITLNLLSVIILNSCSLDLKPENSLTYSNSFNTETELNATTSSIHLFINYYVPENYAFMEAGVLYDENSSGDQYKNWNPRVVADGTANWKGLYDIIFEANLLLDNIDNTKDLTQDRYNFHAGQAHFALGLAYYLLAQRYGDCVITENSSVIKEYEVSPVDKVLDKAIEHAIKGYEILPLHTELKDITGAGIRNKQFASKGSCAALLAHIYAWRGGVIDLYKYDESSKESYESSIFYSSQIISGEVGNYSLCNSPEELCECLSSPEMDNPEAIFSITFDKSRSVDAVSRNNVASQFVSWPVNQTVTLSDIEYYPTSYRLYKETIDNLYKDENDSRRSAFFYQIDEPHLVHGNDYAITYKFRKALHLPDQYAPSGLSFSSIDADYVYWRLADIILLRAECYVKTGKEGDAINDLNVIRNRAGSLNYPSTYDNEGLQKAIFREREKEFICENDARYFDIVRNNYVKTELCGNFKTLSEQDILGGALYLPIPSGAYENSEGQVINTKINQKKYWIPFM